MVRLRSLARPPCDLHREPHGHKRCHSSRAWLPSPQVTTAAWLGQWKPCSSRNPSSVGGRSRASAALPASRVEQAPGDSLPRPVPGELRERARAALHAPSSWPGAEDAIGPGHLEYLPFQSPFRMIMGTAPLDPAEWIQVDPWYAADMSLRKHILRTRREHVLASLGGDTVDQAKRELLDALLHHLPRRFPGIFRAEGSLVHNSLTGDTLDVAQPGRDPLELAALLVQEDLCLMMADPTSAGAGAGGAPGAAEEYRLVAGAVLFPNGWDLREKLGQSTGAIHSPVPLYHDKIGRRVDAFMRKLAPGKPFWRANWSISSDPTLYRPLNEHEYAVEAESLMRQRHVPLEKVALEDLGDRLFTRCERETFVRFPRSRAVLFTIRTFVKPLRVFRGRPALASSCVHALDDLPDEVVKYKMLGPVKPVARRYLEWCIDGCPEHQQEL